MAGAVSARGREGAAGPAQGRRGPEGRGHQDAQAEDWRAGPGPGHPQGGDEGPPFSPADVRRVKASLVGVSERRLCRVLAIARTWARRPSGSRRRRPVVNETLAARVAELIQTSPTFGYRRLWALLRCR